MIYFCIYDTVFFTGGSTGSFLVLSWCNPGDFQIQGISKSQVAQLVVGDILESFLIDDFF
jgi:hypothetical protein